ncbi:MAG: leucyl/phenylalanyl-tRNA--protein transferase [Pseudomonadota bacterium]
MALVLLGEDPQDFPPPSDALRDPDGLLAVGGDLSVPRLLAAYRRGIFPWFSRGDPILWWSPDPRYCLVPADIHVGRSLRRTLARAHFRYTFDADFPAVIDACARAPRAGQRGTWITKAMRDAYVDLHRAGHAHSVEAWRGDELAGGLYGVAIGRMFFGESMFSRVDDASKAAFVVFCRHLAHWGFPLLDCQMETAHLARFGAGYLPRPHFLDVVSTATALPAPDWRFDPGLAGNPHGSGKADPAL